MTTLVHPFLQTIDAFARAGGGGSAGGGGAGGGGGVVVLIAAVGFIPMHFLGAFIRKRAILSDKWTKAQIAGWSCSVLFFVFLFSLCFASTQFTDNPTIVGLIGLAAMCIGVGGFIGMGTGLYDWFDAVRRSRKTCLELQQAASLDPVWDEPSILATTKDIFLRYQTDWTRRDIEAMKQYMTMHYWQHASLLVAILLQAGRINQLSNIVIQKMLIVGMTDSPENEQDYVTVGITAGADDKLFDEPSGELLFEDTRTFTEFWKLKRSGNSWLLAGINQATESENDEEQGLRQLAEDNGYFYSLDMGWLFIPKRGALFSYATFGSSDINNHIVGIYKQTYLLQLYTYASLEPLQPIYVIAQTNVPKNYGRIVVRHKQALSLGPKGLRRISMESNDFNKRYEVFATDVEAVTSFELLHPAFMEKLAGLPFEVNIEVVDNVIYLYAPLRQDADDRTGQYETMLEVFMEAYKQMRM